MLDYEDAKDLGHRLIDAVHQARTQIVATAGVRDAAINTALKIMVRQLNFHFEARRIQARNNVKCVPQIPQRLAIS
jgi:hemerythrin